MNTGYDQPPQKIMPFFEYKKGNIHLKMNTPFPVFITIIAIVVAAFWLLK